MFRSFEQRQGKLSRECLDFLPNELTVDVDNADGDGEKIYMCSLSEDMRQVRDEHFFRLFSTFMRSWGWISTTFEDASFFNSLRTVF